jgi:transcriptional regulator with XRE-family HTH domain
MARHGEQKGREIGGRIAEARKEAGGMTQEELAALLHVSPRSVQAYESGHVIPYRQLPLLERALGKPAPWFLHGDPELQARDEQFQEILEELRALRREVRELTHSANASAQRGDRPHRAPSA